MPTQWQRYKSIILVHPTAQTEALVGLFIIFLRGVVLLSPEGGNSLATPIPSWYLYSGGLTEQTWGWILLVLGSAQVIAAGTHWWRLRGIVATVVAAVLAVIVLAYVVANETGRPTVSFLGGTVLIEIFIAWRIWRDRDLLDRYINDRGTHAA
jgi:hypothetical protein